MDDGKRSGRMAAAAERERTGDAEPRVGAFTPARFEPRRSPIDCDPCRQTARRSKRAADSAIEAEGLTHTPGDFVAVDHAGPASRVSSVGKPSVCPTAASPSIMVQWPRCFAEGTCVLQRGRQKQVFGRLRIFNSVGRGCYASMRRPSACRAERAANLVPRRPLFRPAGDGIRHGLAKCSGARLGRSWWLTSCSTTCR